jgi:hypothetical protein
MQEVPCPNDAAHIPLIAEVSAESVSVRFYWCGFCGELFGFVGNACKCAIGFGWNQRWYVFRARGTEDEQRIVLSVVDQVPSSVRNYLV